MEISITEFRRDLFDLVNQALEGSEVWVRHKGRRFRIAPEGKATSRLARITPMAILSSDSLDLNDPALKAEVMTEVETACEADWSEL